MTPFGKICRKIRIDKGELLRDMANKLGVTPAYLSAVELSKRKVPKDWPQKISVAYYLKTEAAKELKESAYQNHINVHLQSQNEEEAILSAAREDGLSVISWIRGLIIKELKKRRRKK